MIDNYHNDIQQIDIDKAWNNLHARLQEDNLIPIAAKESSIFAMPVFRWAVAAMLALCLTTVVIRYFVPDRHKTPLLSMRNNDADNTLVKTLEDGSTVYLAGSSSLFYPSRFAKDSREVVMQGNALFDIAKNPEKPFRIETKKIIVEVLGTAFNVKSDAKGSFELAVLRGKVKVTQKSNGEFAYVVAGEQATIVDNHWQKTKYTNNCLLESFTKHMKFKDESLEKIVQVINQYSQRKVALQGEAIKNHKLNVQFYNNDVEGMTKVISLALHLKREVSQDSIFISQP
jgi:ferric-dicitrate binding protein FerR (iron transport regulator)